MKIFISTLSLFLFFSSLVFGQGIVGKVTNQTQEPLAFVNIYIKTLETGTTTNAKGEYYFVVQPGEYEVIFSSLGYQSFSQVVRIDNEEVTLNVTLQPDDIQLNEVVIKASKKNPAYEIIRKVIANKEKHLKSAKNYRCEVYLKASEILDEKERKKPKTPKKEGVTLGLDGIPVDPFESAPNSSDKELKNINLTEIQMTLNFKAPDLYKEERTAYKSYGDKTGLFIPSFEENDFNIYRGLLPLKGIAETPVISPLNKTAILSYKYKLEAQTIENGQVVYKIKVQPRKTGNSTCSGYLYVNDGLWNINRFELDFYKGGLKIYDAFRLTQVYIDKGNDTWAVNRQLFHYEEKQGRFKTFKGTTTIFYSKREYDFPFPPKFFGNEVATTSQEAYERDSVYWKNIRPTALTKKEAKMVSYRDSLQAVLTSKPYLDSVDAAFNKITLGEVLWHGIGFQNHEKKKRVYIGSLTGGLEFELIGGLRVALPYTSYFKKWKNERYVYVGGWVNMGLRNQDFQGTVSADFRYDPFHQGFLNIRLGRAFYSINPDDAYLNQLKVSNYILNDRLTLWHNRELFNGFFFRTRFDFSDRQSIQNFDSRTFINDWIDDESTAIEFEDYQAFITEFRLSYTPKQRYMREPYRKVILGSNYPTFSFTYKKGWNRIFSSDIDFDYIEGAIGQNLILGILGESKYTLKAGRFINTKDLRYVDLRRFRQSDPYLYSDPLSSFQLLDTSLIANGWFFEAHHIHHFNGALINNIPFIKHLKLRAVAGAGFLWVKDDNYRHEELFAGVERIFKIGKRRRLRIGLFGVVASSNQTGVNTGFKISFDIIDTWKRDWSY